MWLLGRRQVHASIECWPGHRSMAPRRSADFDTVRQIKERLCYCAFDYQQETKVRAVG